MITISTSAASRKLIPIPAVDQNGRAGWPQVVALQFAIRLTALKRDLADVRAAADVCGVCGGQPCPSPSFCDACSRADHIKKKGYARGK